MENGADELVKPSTIVVVGNGLDLHCGLKSSFKDFFDSKLMLENDMFKNFAILKNIWYLIFTFAFMIRHNESGSIVPSVNNDNPLWMDVENYIDKVFKTKDSRTELKIYDFINNELHNHTNFETYLANYIVNITGDPANQKSLIAQRVSELKRIFNKPEDLLMGELKQFEEDFTLYMKEEIEQNKDTYEKKLTNFLSNELKLQNLNDLFILSFNYSTNFKNIVKSENVVNIHGTLDQNNIIIGTGDNEKGGLPGRDNFKKTNRRIKDNFGSLRLPEKENIKEIIFYGCSFSTQDYNYYQLIFKKFELEKPKIIFKFLYSNFGETEEENNKNKDKYYEKMSEAVNQYLEKTKSNINLADLYNDGYIKFEPI